MLIFLTYKQKKVFIYKLNANFLTHFLNLVVTTFGCVHSTIPGPPSLRTSKSLLIFCVWAGCCSKAALPLLHNHTATPKNLAKPSTVASETHPSSFKQPRQHPTIQHGDPIFRWSRHRPRICRPNVSGLESFVARYSPRTCRCLSIVRTTRIDVTYYRPNIQHGYPISCQSRHAPRICHRHGPRICRERITARIRSLSHYSPNSVVIPLQPKDLFVS